MKRSEIKKGISNFLLEKARYSGQDIADEVAELVLSYIENMGMQPPFRYRSHDWNEKGMTYSEWLQLRSKINEWEPEDEA